MRLEVPPPYRGRPHPGDHRSVRCRPVRDGCLKGGRSSRCARVALPPLPCHASARSGEQHPRRSAARGGQRRAPPSTLVGLLHATTNTPNRTLAIPRPPPRRSRRVPPPALAGIEPPAPAGRPKGHIAKPSFFPGSLLQKGNSNSVAIFLILVNCVENHRKIRKMQGQFLLNSR
jgi:hypothetical protein